MEIFSVTSEDTKQTIIKLYEKLSDRDRLIFERTNEEQSRNNIAANLNISKSRVAQILYYGSRSIHKDLKRRYYMKRSIARGHRVRSCSIFSTGKVTSETLSVYKSLISFLISSYVVSCFYIEYTHLNSDALCSVVREGADCHRHHITVVTDSEEYLEPIEELRDIVSAFHPPYDTLEYIAQLEYPGLSRPLGFFSVMIDRADFCICDLSASDCPDAIKNYVSKRGKTVLLDIGKANAQIDFS